MSRIGEQLMMDLYAEMDAELTYAEYQEANGLNWDKMEDEYVGSNMAYSWPTAKEKLRETHSIPKESKGLVGTLAGYERHGCCFRSPKR